MKLVAVFTLRHVGLSFCFISYGDIPQDFDHTHKHLGAYDIYVEHVISSPNAQVFFLFQSQLCYHR